MGKKLKPVQIETPNHLAEVTFDVRAEFLGKLEGEEKQRVLENLIESAMVMGLMDSLQIREWLGLRGISNINAIESARNRVMKRWLDETNDIVEYARTQRATQIKKAWEEVRNCEEMFLSTENMKDKTAIKKLQLEWMQYITKLSFVEKMTEANQSDMQIIVNGSVGIQKKEETNGD